MLDSGLSPLKVHDYHATLRHATLPRERRVRACRRYQPTACNILFVDWIDAFLWDKS